MGSPWRLWTCDPTCRVWEGVTLESVEIWPQVNDVEGGVTLEAEVMWPKVQDMGRGVTLETGCVTEVQGLGTVWVSSHPHGSGSCTWRPHMCSTSVCLVRSEVSNI